MGSATLGRQLIAQKLGRTRSAVTSKCVTRKIRAFSGSPGGGRAWTNEEIALLGTDRDEAIAARIGRTAGAVAQKRAAREGDIRRVTRGGFWSMSF